ncbi:MAG: hypothetical protein HC802_14465 [Caldilineaceae bacterium]|nr:hypothetical protein [Caldilineaceae bacterium]
MQSPAFRATSAIVSFLLLGVLGLVVWLVLRGNPTTTAAPALARTPAVARATAPQSSALSASQAVAMTDILTGTVILGSEQRVTQGGFAFRPIDGYTLDVANNSVTLAADDGSPFVGSAFLLSGGELEQFVSEPVADLEEAFAQYVTFFAQADNFRIGKQQRLTVDGADGIGVDLIGADAGDLFAGRVVMAQADDDQVFVLVGVAPVEAWESITAAQFDALLGSVRLLTSSAVARATGEPVLQSAIPPTLTQTPTPLPLPSPTVPLTVAPTVAPTPTPQPTRTGQWNALSNGNYVNGFDLLNNSVWAATDGGSVAWNVESNGSVKFTSADGLATNRLKSVVVCPLPGLGVVFASDYGLQVFDTQGGNWKRISSDTSGMSFDDVAALFCNRESGHLVVGYAGHGVDILDTASGKWRYLDEADNLEYDAIRLIATVGEPEQIWIASDLGLSLLARGGIPAFHRGQQPAGQQRDPHVVHRPGGHRLGWRIPEPPQDRWRRVVEL